MATDTIKDIRLHGFTFKDEKSGTYPVVAWCFECEGWHTHGGFKAEPQLGLQLHRYPHCYSDRYMNGDYEGCIIEIEGPASTEVLADYRRKNPRGLKKHWRNEENPIADTHHSLN